MGNYQIGKDIQSLDERLKALEGKHDCGCKSRPLGEDELSETQKKNLDLLRRHSQEIVTGMNEVLRAHGVNLFVAKFPALFDQEFAGPQLFPQAGGCCCENGVYVEDCDQCGFIIKSPPVPGGPIPIPVPIP